MIMIVLSHYVYYGGLLQEALSSNQILAQLLRIGGKLGVTCFVLIGAYFLIDSKFKFVNVIRLFGEVVFYSGLMLLIHFFMGGSVSGADIVRSLLSPFWGIYWFPTVYICLYISFPILNVIIRSVGEELYKIVLLLMLFLCFGSYFPGHEFLFSNLLWFYFLYFVAALLKQKELTWIEKNAGIICCFSIIFMWTSSIMFSVLGKKYEITFLENRLYIFSEMTSPFMLFAGISLFVLFKKIKMENSIIVNYIASLTFAVYLIHENRYMRNWLWNKILNTSKYYTVNIGVLFIHMVFALIFLFASAALIEVFRRYIQKWMLKRKWIVDISNIIDNWYTFEKK